MRQDCAYSMVTCIVRFASGGLLSFDLVGSYLLSRAMRQDRRMPSRARVALPPQNPLRPGH